MKRNTELISRINQLMEQNADNANSFASKVGIDPGNFRKKLKGEYGVTKKDIYKICNALGVSKEWLEEGKGDIYINGNVNIGSNDTMRDIKFEGDTAYKALEMALKAPRTESLDRLFELIAGKNPYELENKLLKEQVADLRKQVDFLQGLVQNKRG